MFGRAARIVVVFLALPTYAIVYAFKCARAIWRSRFAIAMVVPCSECGQPIHLVGTWRCRTDGFTYSGHVLRSCPVCHTQANLDTVLSMRSDKNNSLNVQLTSRDQELLEIVAAAGFLTTRQIHQHFFQGASVNACQKRLRKLAAPGYLAALRLSRTEQQLWRLGRTGIRTLTGIGCTGLVVPKRAPANLFPHSRDQ